MSTFVYEGGGGGQKSPKNRPRGLCMTPNHRFIADFAERGLTQEEQKLRAWLRGPVFQFVYILIFTSIFSGRVDEKSFHSEFYFSKIEIETVYKQEHVSISDEIKKSI